MRVTTNMVSKSYYRDLNKTYEAYARAAQQSESFRKFEKASEDPVSSLKAYRFKQEISENTSYQSNVSSLKETLSTQESSIKSIQDVVSHVHDNDCLGAITGTNSGNPSIRETYATRLRTLQASLVSDANVKFSDNYLFGGSGTSEAPFSVDSSGNLLYRGIDVNTGKIAAGTSTVINGVSITLGDTAGDYDGYTIQVANDATAAKAVNIDETNKIITVNLNLSSGSPKTNEDLFSALKTEFTTASMTGDTQRPITVEQPCADFNGAQIKLGDVGVAFGSYSIKVVDGGVGSADSIDITVNTVTVSMDLQNATAKTNQDLFELINSKFPNATISGNTTNTISSESDFTANVGLTTAKIGKDTQLNLGDLSGKYNGYTIEVRDGVDKVDTTTEAGKIIVTMNVGPSTTVKDLLKMLQTNSDFSNASISGNLSTSVTTATTVKLSSSNLPISIASNTIGLNGLTELANEKCYVDIGSGVSFDSSGKLNSQSAFNISVPGISVLGYGSADGTGTGMSNNLYTLMGQLADELESPSYSYNGFASLYEQFKKQANLLSDAVTTSGTNSAFLISTADRLTEVGDNAADALDEAAYVDIEDAYQNYTTRYYQYQCALKIGTDLLQSTILDYMR